MGLTVFQALDKAIEAGATNLAGKDIGGSGKAAALLLDEMCSSGLLEKGAGKSPKYTVTPKGRETWEREAPDDRRREVTRREQEQQRQALAAFLAVVGKKQGKALTKTELTRSPATVRQEACERKLVEAGSKPNSYRLLPAGGEMLLTLQPVEEQLERLRQLHKQIIDQWRAAQQRLAEDVQGAGSPALQAAAEQLAKRGDTACRAFDDALAELGGLGGVAGAAKQLRAEVEAATRQTQQAVAAEKARLAELEARLRQEAEQQREQLGAFERRVEERLADFARRQEAAKPNVPGPPPPLRNGPPEAAVWEAARSAHERLRQESLRVGGIVKVPELTDAVRRAAEGLTASAFHDLLRKWQQEDRLTLQLCNDPRLEPRAAEGIQSPRGLLFYVQMR